MPVAKRAESELKKYEKQALRANKTLLQTVMQVPKLEKSKKKPIYSDVYSESEHGAESLKKKQVRHPKKICKFKGSIKQLTNSQKKGKFVRPPKYAQVVESDDSNDIDSPPIPVITQQSLFNPRSEASTSQGSSLHTSKFFQPSCNRANTSDSAPSPPSANRAGNPTDERDGARQKKDIHSRRLSAEGCEQSAQLEYRGVMINEDRNVLNDALNGAREVIPEVASDNPLDDQRLRQKLPKETFVLLKAIKALAVDVQRCKCAVENMQGMMERSKIVQDIVRDGRSFVGKYSLQIPFTNVEEFKLFDQMLKHNAECRKDLTTSLQFHVNPDNNPGRTVTAVLKKYMTRDVALNFTAVKHSLTKSAFKDLNFCSCLLDFVVQAHTDKDGAPIGEKTFYKVLGASFANAKDWDGHRLHGHRH